MKITTSRTTLEGALTKTFSVAAKTTTMPALQFVRATVDDSTLTLIGRDLELAVQTQVGVEADGAGEFLIPPSVFDMVRLCPADQPIVLDVGADTAEITCGSAHWSIRLDRELIWPAIDIAHEGKVTAPKTALSKALGAALGAVSTPNIRKSYAHIQFTATGAVRATDGNRLHQSSTLGEIAFIDALVPMRAAAEIIKRTRSMAVDSIEVGETDFYLSFKLDDDLLLVAKPSVEYPDIDRHMIEPTLEYTATIEVDRKALFEATQRVSLVADAGRHLSIRIEDEGLRLATVDQLGNSANEEVDASVASDLSGRSLLVNSGHLLEMLESTGESVIHLRMGEDDGPRLTTLLLNGGSFTGVLAQLRSDFARLESAT